MSGSANNAPDGGPCKDSFARRFENDATVVRGILDDVINNDNFSKKSKRG